ncbi:MAG: Asp-tRNA(Asn)/Glu-tRNA(Gln) amidotransferase subunit GatC, partial [Smithellaceae bacterium]|nr:Asp-tRNA(Asn)/Glu-tRNA(Gln) amidotransferase subunit GatC [Smithellaceae bacterium]
MKLSTSDVEYVAKLARLEITEAEKQKFTAQLNDILLYIDQLNELDTTGVAPMSHAIAVTNAFREDRVVESLGTQRA